MAITYTLGTDPKWYLSNLNGTSAGGAYLFTYDALTRSPKIVYMDAFGNQPWDNPIVFDATGTQGPFYFAIDSANSGDGYFLDVYNGDPRNPTTGAEQLWTIDNYIPPGAGGSGGGGTEYVQLTNYITNGAMINNLGSSTTTTTNITSLVVAPSNHKGFTPYTVNPIIGTYGALGPDIMFLKNSTANTDSVSFQPFTLASSPLAMGGNIDITPVDYLQYQCTTNNIGESYKSFQFPITQKVKNLSNQIMTFKIWAATGTGTANIQPYLRQYYGSGTAATPESNTTLTTIGSPLALTTTWTAFYVNFTVPSVASGSLGTPGLQTDDDALYIQLWMPLNLVCLIYFTKPALYLGNVQPKQDFNTYDQIDSINSTARTGDVKTSYLAIAPRGWLPMNDGSIGNTGSGATLATGAYTFALYKTIWDNVINTWAPVSTGRGATALADFLAGKTLTLPRALGRAMAGAGSGTGLNTTVLGQWQGADTLTGPDLPLGTPYNPNPGTANFVFTTTGTANVPGNNGGNAWSFGTGPDNSNIQPTTYFNVFIKL